MKSASFAYKLFSFHAFIDECSHRGAVY